MALTSTAQFPSGLEAQTTSGQYPTRDPPDDKGQPEMATIYDDDERLLARIGYTQVTVGLLYITYHPLR